MALNALQGFWFGLVLGAGIWVPFGRWSLLLLMRRSWRAQQLRQLAVASRAREDARVYPRPQARHAGRYVQPDRVRAGVCQLEAPDWFRRVPG